MKLSKKQLLWFWRLWAELVTAKGWSKQEAEEQRHLVLASIGFDSLKEVTVKKGFDALLGKVHALLPRTDAALGPQLRVIRMPRTRALVKIQVDLCAELATVLNDGVLPPLQTAAENYILAIMADKYHTQDFDSMTDSQLVNLIVDITHRINQRRKTLRLTWPELRSRAAGQLPPTNHAAAA